MNEFRRLAAKIDQHMQQLAAEDVSEDVSEAHAIINRMMGIASHRLELCLTQHRKEASSDSISNR